MIDKDKNKELEADLIKFMQTKHKSAQEKYNAIQALAKKYNIPLQKLLKNIIVEWINEDREKKFGKKS